MIPFNKRYLTGKEFYFSILITIFLYVIIYSFFDVSFDDNDDVGIALISNGGITGFPDEHLIFINSVYGFILKSLYQITNTVDWYSLVLIGLQFVAILTIYFLMFKNKVVIPIILLLTVYFVYLISIPQFTNVSTLLAIAGIYSIYCKSFKSNFDFAYIYPIILLFFSSLIRFEAFVLVFVIGACYIVFKREKIENCVDLIKPLLLLGLFISFSFYVNYESYSSKDWQLYKKYNVLRGKINDNPNFYSAKNLISKNTGLKKSEIDLFSQFTYTSSFDLATLEKIDKIVSKPLSLISYFENLKHSINYRWLWLIVGILSIIFFRIKKRYLIPIFILVAIFLIISLNHVTKARVVLPLFIEIIFFSLLFLEGEIKNRFLLLSIIMTIFPILFLCSRIYGMQKIISINSDSIYKYKELNNDKNYIVLRPISFIRGGIKRPFNLNKAYKSNVLAYGWLNNSPLQSCQLKKINANHKLPISLFDDEVLFDKCEYITNTGSDDSVLETLKLYLKENGLELKKVNSIDEYNFYKIIKYENPLQ